MEIRITKCEEQGEYPAHYGNLSYKTFLVTGFVDGAQFSVAVMPFCGEYDYEEYPEILGDDDEPLQIAIGQYFEHNNIDVGRVGR